jgi:hypothetical protein
VVLLTIEAPRVVQQAGADQNRIAAIAELDVDAFWRSGEFGQGHGQRV